MRNELKEDKQITLTIVQNENLGGYDYKKIISKKKLFFYVKSCFSD
jgi:hypothetical protein